MQSKRNEQPDVGSLEAENLMQEAYAKLHVMLQP